MFRSSCVWSREYCSNRMVIVSSNDEAEYGFCKERILITDYK